jgi:[acyl-carrier-protein] S-malonyltransferase
MNTAFIFPGQGSQSVGMLNQLYDCFPQYCTQYFELISQHAGFNVWDLVHNGPNDKLNQTEYTQVAMLASDVLIYQLFRQAFPETIPQVMAGHSLGEYAALVCAGAMTIEQGIKIVRRRGQLMQEAVPLGEGAMAAIVGLENATASSLCDMASDEAFKVSPANFNAPGQVVVAGHTAAVEKAITLAEKQNARLAKMIPVSVPCHCDLLTDVASEFETYLSQFTFLSPKTPVVANVNAKPYTSAEEIRPWLTKQLYSPVLWVESIDNMVRTYSLNEALEVGPGNVLSGLVKRIDRSLKPISALSQLLTSQVLTNQ